MDEEWDVGNLTCRCLQRMELANNGWSCGDCGIYVLAEAAGDFREAFVRGPGNIEFGSSSNLRATPHPPSLRERVAALREELVEVVESFGAANPRLFGSVARGDDGPRSDVDLMVDLEPGTGLFSLLRIQDAAEQLLGVRVDVTDAAGMGEDARRDAVPL